MTLQAHHPNAGSTNDWITPSWIIDTLGPFDLDPCASEGQPWPTAKRMISLPDNGYAAQWEGRIWLNPPYGPHGHTWIQKLSTHPEGGTALVFARIETEWWRMIWQTASAILFPHGRLTFHLPYTGEPGRGNAGAPSALVAFGPYDARRLGGSGIAGSLVSKWGVQ